MLLAALLRWLEREQRDVITFLREENRAPKAQLGSRRLRLNDDQRRRLAVLGLRLGRGMRTILRWHRADCAEVDLRQAAAGPTCGTGTRTNNAGW